MLSMACRHCQRGRGNTRYGRGCGSDLSAAAAASAKSEVAGESGAALSVREAEPSQRRSVRAVLWKEEHEGAGESVGRWE